MLEMIFIRILNMSITAGIMVLFVMLLRFFLKSMPKIYSYVLWTVVFFRLVCPVSFTTDYSLLGLINVEPAQQGRIEYISADVLENLDEAEITENKIEMNMEEDAVSKVQGLIQRTEETAFSGFHGKLLIKAGSLFWFFGMVLLAGSSIREFILLQKGLKEAVLEKESIYYSKNIKTPFTIGIFKPAIILPANLKEEEKVYIILHEQVHIQRKDHIIRIISFILLCVHWFNPLIWAAFFISGRDMEMSCDETVVRKLGSGVKKDYSMSLLSLASGQRIVGGTPLLFGEGDTKGRIKNVLNFKEPKKVAALAAVGICIVAGVFLSANPAINQSGNNTKNLNSQKKELQNKNSQKQDNQNPDSQDKNSWSASSLADKEEDPKTGSETLIEQQYNVYNVNVRGISRSARCIDRYKMPIEEQIKSLGLEDAYNEETGMMDKSLAFAEDCVFKTNYSMNTIEYEEISFDTFADIIEEGDPNLNKSCILTIEDNLVTEIILENAYGNYGISFSEKTNNSAYREMENIVKEVDGENTNMLETYYTLVYSSLSESAKKWDVVDSISGESQSMPQSVWQEIQENEEIEAIEVYTGNIGDGSSGYVIVRNADGDIIYTEFAHTARAGWNNIYLGSINGTDYLMTVHIEDRDDFGGYHYEVFRLDKNGEILQIAGSEFKFGDYYIYDNDLFKEWAAGLEYYLENSQLILSSQEGEIHTEAKPEEVYKYETLRRQ